MSSLSKSERTLLAAIAGLTVLGGAADYGLIDRVIEEH